MAKYLLVGTSEFKTITYEGFAGGIHSFVTFWSDFRALNGNIYEGKYRVFVDQHNDGKIVSRPKIFITHLVDDTSAQNVLYHKTDELRDFVNNLSIQLGMGGRLVSNEAFCIEAGKYPAIDLEHIFLNIKNHVVHEVVWIDPSKKVGDDEQTVPGISTRVQYAMKAAITNDDYNSVYIEFFVPFETNSNLNLLNKQKKKSLNDTDKFNQLCTEGNHFSVICDLYNEAVTSTNIRISFLLLWQIIEYISDIIEDKQVVKDGDISDIGKLLVSKGYDKDMVKNRVCGSLKVIGERAQIDKIVQGVNVVFPNVVTEEELVTRIKKLRGVRGEIVHPKHHRKIYSKKIIGAYSDFRELMDKLFLSLSPDSLEQDAESSSSAKCGPLRRS